MSGKEPIAIIGMGCRFPAANNLREFWQLLSKGKDAITNIPPERFDIDALYDPDQEPQANWCRAAVALSTQLINSIPLSLASRHVKRARWILNNVYCWR